MSNIFDLTIRYPWLPSSKEEHKNLIDYAEKSKVINDIFSSENSNEITDRIYNFFEKAIEKEENNYKLDNLNVYFYLLIKILLIIFNDKILTNRVAESYSKINYDYLQNEDPSFIKYICENELDLNIKSIENIQENPIELYENNPQKIRAEFKIYFIDYLKLSTYLRDEYRKLVNNYLSEGYIYLKKKRLIRLIQEEVRKKILEVENQEIEGKDELFKIKGFEILYKKILDIWREKKDEFENLEFHGTEDSNLYPPCIKEIISKAEEGQNLIHIERLVVLFFFLELNVPLEEIINFFQKMPDFDQEKTTYQVNFAKRKGYKPHLCETLKSLDLCKASKDKEKICTEGYFSITQDKPRQIRSPLQYVKVRKYRIAKGEKSKHNNMKL